MLEVSAMKFHELFELVALLRTEVFASLVVVLVEPEFVVSGDDNFVLEFEGGEVLAELFYLVY